MCGAAFAIAAAPARSQNPELDRVDRLTSEGRLEEARAGLLEWWDTLDPTIAGGARVGDQALWLRARLTVDPEIAASDLAAILEVYPGGEFAPRASIRLAQFDLARGDPDGAEGRLRSFLSANPESPYRVEIRNLLEALEGGDEPEEDEAGQRGRSAGRSNRGGARRGGRAQAETVARHAVQLGTYQTASEAVAMARRAIEAGFEARLVRIQGSQLVRVRVGLFTNPLDASQLLVQLRAQGFAAAAVENADREQRIGGGGGR